MDLKIVHYFFQKIIKQPKKVRHPTCLETNSILILNFPQISTKYPPKKQKRTIFHKFKQFWWIWSFMPMSNISWNSRNVLFWCLFWAANTFFHICICQNLKWLFKHIFWKMTVFRFFTFFLVKTSFSHTHRFFKISQPWCYLISLLLRLQLTILAYAIDEIIYFLGPP